MDLKIIQDNQKEEYNQLVNHIMQSWEWGEFRKSLDTPLYRFGLYDKDTLKIVFQFTLHKIPFLPYSVGYFAKGPFPDKDLAEALKIIAKEHQIAFIKLEPNILISDQRKVDNTFKVSPKPLFTKHNFILDLTPSEEELLAKMHQKTRYNIRLAQKKGVEVKIADDDKTFEQFLDLHFETTKRQGFFSHDRSYHQKLWQSLKSQGLARIAIGYYENKPLSAWLLINFKHTLYYLYGGSSTEHKEVMANNLVAWEAIKLGKSLGLTSFDLWGALGPDASENDPWQGFHRFKQGYNPELVEYIGTFDLIFNPFVYHLFTFIDKFTKLKVFLLKLVGR